jgi:hypothetical protein
VLKPRTLAIRVLPEMKSNVTVIGFDKNDSGHI